eukprot:gnl/TRDRNA2_/TRDRNA2_78642_c0_seq1.p1 gnl/TRDRNA2_/TRDRNA2_78642_c0~~gnl/TRDRNA2_/TRDRNA2_78642_c0_seq1.p1  ORF type:complete len:360 (+),score=52.47 gnl/TRDRNA2_/TRDRNA2_78642_c0_seq1:100-1080(+)
MASPASLGFGSTELTHCAFIAFGALITLLTCCLTRMVRSRRKLASSQQESGAVDSLDGEETSGDGADCSKADILASLRVAEDDVERMLGTAQRYGDGRAHPAWIEARRNRVTASRFASACGAADARERPKDVVRAMLSLPEAHPRQASRFGVQYERTARDAYVQHRRQQASDTGVLLQLEVREVGLCVWSEEPWLGASPDGICWENGIPAGLLEVKTHGRWTELFEREPPADWLYQVTGGMRLASAALGTSLSWCDLWLWTPERCACRRIIFDKQLWERSILPALRGFYFDLFLPAAVEHAKAERAQRRKAEKRSGKKRLAGKRRR